MTEKIDAREVYGDDGLRIDCDCNMERACTECVDCGVYEDGQLPEPPPFILLNWCIGSHQGCDCPDCYTAEQNGER